MSELSDIEVLIIIGFLVILTVIYGISEIRYANRQMRKIKELEFKIMGTGRKRND
jgi:hypothetical protein